jgi:hypothetical protein
MERALVIDLETKKSFAEVGGRDNYHLLGVAVAGVYDYVTDEFSCFEEAELGALEARIKERDLVVGFNIQEFDYKVLQPYFSSVRLTEVPTLDLLKSVEREVGFRVGLDALSRSTLNEGKTADGMQALSWIRQGELAKAKEYCLSDVRLTKDLYEYGKSHGEVRFAERGGEVRTVPVSWGSRQSIRELLAQAFEQKLLVEVEYVSEKRVGGASPRTRYSLEIHGIQGSTIEGYSKEEPQRKSFDMLRIVRATMKEDVHTKPTLF